MYRNPTNFLGYGDGERSEQVGKMMISFTNLQLVSTKVQCTCIITCVHVPQAYGSGVKVRVRVRVRVKSVNVNVTCYTCKKSRQMSGSYFSLFFFFFFLFFFTPF